MKYDRRERHRVRDLQVILRGQFAPLIGHRLLRAQSQVGCQHFVRLPRYCLANAVGQKPDRCQSGYRQADGRKQYENFTGAKLTAEAT